MMRRAWKQALLLILMITSIIPIFPGVASASVLPFYASAQTSGSMTVKLYPTENVSPGVSTVVTFGVPFTRGSVAPADLNKIRVLKGGVEIGAFVEMQTPWRHISNPLLDGTSVRVARIQISYTFTNTFPSYEEITVQWGTTTRTQNVSTKVDPKSAWHQVVSGTFVAADNIYEPDVYAVLPKAVLSGGVLNPQQMTPAKDEIGLTRDDPFSMDAVEHYPDFDEFDYSFKNFFYTVINEDNIGVTLPNPYKTAGPQSETWLYDRSATMYDLYFMNGSFRALREATRSTQFYASQLWDDSTANVPTIGMFKLKATASNSAGGNNAMYSYNESMAYNYWLTGNDDMLDPIDWIVNVHELNTVPTRWSISLTNWTERHTSFRLLANIIAYEVLGLTKYKDKVVSQTDDFIWHQNGADGAFPSGYVDGGLYHKGKQHADDEGVREDFLGSSWMTVLVQQSMIRAYSVLPSNEIAGFIKRVGNFLKATVKYDPYHIYDSYPGTLAYPDYLMKYDGTPDAISGNRGSAGNPHGGSTIDHNISVATGMLWAEYFNQLLGGSPDATMTDIAMDLYYGYDIGVNFYTRPGNTVSSGGKAEYRYGVTAAGTSNSFRKWSWEYKPSVSLSWLADQLGASVKLPPELEVASPAAGEVLSAPATIGIEALVKATSASITKVEFFNGSTKLGEKTSPPYNYTWSSVAAGNYAVKVVATDSNGKTNEVIRNISVLDTTGFSNYRAVLSSGVFKSLPIGTQSGTFTIELDAKPLAANLDAGISLSQGAASSWSMPAVVRFGASNTIEARNDITYTGATPYSPNTTYHFRIVVNTPAKTYSVYVTPEGGSEITIATDINFRSTPVVSTLNTLNVMSSGSGGLLIGNVTGGSADITPPTVSVTAPSASGTISGSTTLTASASDASGIANVQFYVDGIRAGSLLTTSPYTTTFNASTLSNGTHAITAKATDTAGNVTVSAPVSVTVTGGGSADSTGPSVSITAPSAGTVSGIIAIAATASDDVRVGGVTFKVDGRPIKAEVLDAPFTASYDTSSLTAGSHTITAVARDTSGNTTTSSSVEVNVTDSTPPQVIIATPSAGTIYSTSFQLSAVAADNAGIAGVRFYADGNPLAAEDTTVPFSLTVTSGMLSAGSHELTAIARDTSNNTTTSSPVIITFSPDTTAPTVSVTAPTASSTNSGIIVLTASASDDYGVANVQFKIDGNPVGPLLTAAPYELTYNTMHLTDGNHSFTATAKDFANNTTTSSTVTASASNGSGGTGTVSYQDGVGNYDGTRDFHIISGSANEPNRTLTTVYLRDTTNGLLRFDDIVIPPGTKVSSASLSLVYNGGAGLGPIIDGRYLQTPWNGVSGLINWNKRTVFDFWNTPGAEGDGTDYISGKSFSMTFPTTGTPVTQTLDTAVVQSWLDNPADNHGIVLFSSPTLTTNLTIRSSEHATVASRPKLTINFEPISATSAPAWASGYPAAGTATMSTAPVKVETTTNSTAYFVALASGASAPSSAQVKAGQNAAGSTVASSLRGSAALTANVESTLTATGLTAATTYDIYTVAESSTSDLQSSPTKVTVTTTSNTPPTVTMTSPSDSSTVSGTITLTATATDADGIASVQFLSDGVLFGTPDTVSPYTTTFDTTTLTNGTHTFAAKAIDNLNGETTSSAVTVTVANSSGSSGTATFQQGADSYTGAIDFHITSGSSGAPNKTANVMYAYNTTTPSYHNSLLKFGSLSIPAGTVVQSATLTLNRHGGSYGVIEGRYLQTAWNDVTGTINWTQRTASDNWGTPGGTGSGTDTISGKVFEADFQTGTPAVVALDPEVVQSWISNPSTNLGIVLSSSVAGRSIQIRSSDYATVADRPLLTINYVSIPTAPAWVSGYPDAGTATGTTAPVKVKTDINGTAYFVTLPSGAAAPSSAQVKAGQNAAGSTVASSLRGSTSLTANTEATLTATTLTPNTTYDIYVVAESTASDLQSSPVKVTVTTANVSAGTATFQQGVSSYSGAIDFHILSTSTSSPNRTANVMYAYNTTTPSYHNSLLKFSGVSIPSGTVVQSATLTLTRHGGSYGIIEGRYLQTPWNDTSSGTIHWTKRNAIDDWASPGASGSGTDYISGKLFEVDFQSGIPSTTVTLDPAVVQSWIDNPSTNWGVVLSSPVAGRSIQIRSSDYATAGDRPLLTINYVPQ
ncbi:Ig-like domain-containing protein [Paenibacillus koleovorans]|uniref:Ig-like domain-containing protein n=1 Tax=Paenibacillus koleovorans TaxID=121608 RepID=UPI000FD8CFA6|nr:Ig-like domain-containing protein [Paenibacillus koleovorans]